MTPGAVQARGAGLVIRYGVHASPFGPCIIATTPQGVCELAFAEPDDVPETLATLRARWPEAEWTEDPEATAPVRDALFAPLDAPPDAPSRAPFMLLLKGTNFQVRVWEALLRIPPGQTTTYGAIARALGEPGASRAVGNAVGQNPVAALIPCHRVIRQTGALGGYRWGVARKRALLAWEAAGLEAEAHPDAVPA
jgi:AraC family transcriptional regulator of adaptative response/methylated-DNA-[protein]-cysteine methyltransferase